MVKCYMCPTKGDIQLNTALMCPVCKSYYHDSCGKRALELGKLSNGAFVKCCAQKTDKGLTAYSQLHGNMSSQQSQASNTKLDNDEILGSQTTNLSNQSLKIIEQIVMEAISKQSKEISKTTQENMKILKNKMTNLQEQIGTVIDKFETLHGRVEEAFIRIQQIEEHNNEISDGLVHKVVKEVEDRKTRECNLILYNIPEKENIKEDKKVVETLFDSSRFDLSKTKFYRLGKISNSLDISSESSQASRHSRPLKVQFESAETIQWILRNKNAIQWNGISFSLDRTTQQRALHKEARKELTRRETNGEQNLFIKYINGVPRVIERSNSKYKNKMNKQQPKN